MTATHGVGTYGNAAGTVTPLDHKMANLSHWVKTAANTIRAGVLWDGNATIVSGKANMSYDVRALTAVLSRGATAGAVELSNDSVYNVATAAAPGSNSRYDVVYIWQREYSIDGTDSNPVIGVVQGTAAASPTVPSLAAFPGAIQLATILVPAGVTATNSGTTINQTASFTTVADGVVVPRTTTERDAYVPAAADMKARCWVIADGLTYKWNGSAWKAWESDWITYTPTIRNVAVGTGGSASSVWAYKFVAGDVKVKFSLVLGTSGASVSGIPTITVPIARAALAHPYEGTTGFLILYDTANTRPYQGAILAENTDATKVRLVPTNSGALTTAVAATVPFTWGAGSAISGEFSYKAA